MERNTNTSVNVTNVRRRLFTDENENEDEEQNFYNEIMEENLQQSKRAMERWNFDFKNEIPLPGRYKWEKIGEHGKEIPNSINLVNEEQNRNEQEEQTETEEETERNVRRSDEPIDESATKRAKLEES